MHDHPSHEQRLASSSIELPAALPAFGQYVPAGRHTRLAVGVSSLPANMVLEIQALLVVAP